MSGEVLLPSAIGAARATDVIARAVIFVKRVISFPFRLPTAWCDRCGNESALARLRCPYDPLTAMEFRILGPTEADDDGNTLPLGGAKQRALLAILLLHANEVVSTDRLVDDLWAGEPPESGVAALQVRISQLRKALGPAGERVRTQPPGYVLRVEPDELDLNRFEPHVGESGGRRACGGGDHAARGARPLAGRAARGLRLRAVRPGGDRPPRRSAPAALEKRIDADLSLGRHGELVGELETIVA